MSDEIRKGQGAVDPEKGVTRKKEGGGFAPLESYGVKGTLEKMEAGPRSLPFYPKRSSFYGVPPKGEPLV